MDESTVRYHKAKGTSPEFFTRVRKYISADTPERVDIVMNYHEIDEDDILKVLGLKKKDLYLYFDHS